MPHRQSRYDAVALELFRAKHKEGDEEIRFTREELLEAASRVGIQIKNPGDFPYYYSKRHELPGEMTAVGFKGVEVVGHSVYAFTKGADSIIVPPDLPEREVLLAFPSKVRRLVTDDEQGMLVKVRESHLLSDFLGETVFHLQGHLKTEGKLGQVEIDDVYVTEDTGKIVTVEAAEPNEKMIRSQIRRQVAGAVRRFDVSIDRVVPIVIRILGPNQVVVLRLSAGLDVLEGKVYRFREPGASGP